MIWLVTITVFAAAVAGLSLGVLLHKKTPLKGSCHDAASCESCTCKH